MTRRVEITLAVVLLAALYAGTVKPGYFRILATDRALLAQAIDSGPDRRAPGYDDFLESVRKAVPRGATVALLMPDRLDKGESEYRFYRASYLLSGRYVKRISPRDAAAARSIRYLAIWPGDASSLPLDPVLEQGGGALFEQSQ